MKKVVILIVLAVALAGYIGYANKGRDKNQDEGKSGSKVEEFTGNLKEAMGLSVPMKCTMSQNGDSWTSYIKGKDMYLESTTQGKKGYMISKDDCTYTWGDPSDDETGGQPGFKMCVDPEEVSDGAEEWEGKKGAVKAEGVDYNLEYKCAPAVFSDDKFNPPANVEFMGMEEMMKGMMNLSN